MDRSSKIFVAGHTGMVGSAIVRKLRSKGCNHLLLRPSSALDLRSQADVEAFFKSERPEYVILAAAKVGGIMANNTYRAEFLYDNLMIASHVIHASYVYEVKKLLFLGSSCIYPKYAPQPIRETALLSGELETTNEPYAIAKITGIKMCEAYRDQYGCNFIAAMPTNLYGPNDNFDLETSHVLPALLRKFHTAVRHSQDVVEVWGTGAPRREFLHVDDLADAVLFLMQTYDGRQFVNIGTGSDLSIKELADLISQITGFRGEIRWDHTKPDGTPQKLLDVSLIHTIGWRHRIPLREGIQAVYSQIKDEQLFEE